MKNTREIEEQVFYMQNQAHRILDELKIVEAWTEIGAEVNLIGSLKMGLLVKHKDIDFHIYTEALNPTIALGVMKKFETSMRFKKVDYINLSDSEDCCLEFHLYVEDDNSELWQIDMINIKKGSKYDGYFEIITDKILEEMTEEQKQTILKLKFKTPDELKIAGMEYYKAVIQDNVKNYGEFLDWRKEHKFQGIIEW